MAGYTRQHSADIVDGAVIEAAHHNGEYDAIESAFSETTGHTHDGTVGGGTAIPTAGIAADAVTNAKLANMAVNTIKGRITSGTGDPEDLSATQVLTIVKTVDGTGSGLDADLLDGMDSSAFSLSGHVHSSTSISDFAEAVDDRVAALVVQGTGISVTYNDASNTLTIASTATAGVSLGMLLALS